VFEPSRWQDEGRLWRSKPPRFTMKTTSTPIRSAHRGASICSFFMALSLTIPLAPLSGQDFIWTQTTAPTNDWVSVASSSDGTKLVAVALRGGIYTSTDSGLTWIQTSAQLDYWTSVASSSDGTKLVAGANSTAGLGLESGMIYSSTNSGLTWTAANAPNFGWFSIASSSDGTHLIASGGNGYELYDSTNSGRTWTNVRPDSAGIGWSVASSSDGTKIVAALHNYDTVRLGGLVYTSTNSGWAWTQTTAPNTNWQSVASSSDGTRLVAAVRNPDGFHVGGIYLSTNSGVTWSQTSAPGLQNWQAVASSSDGNTVVAVDGGGEIQTSIDGGISWHRSSAPSLPWSCVACSSDGTKLVAASGTQGTQGGQIYTAYTPAPQILKGPDSLLLCPHTVASFRVLAGGPLPLGFQWRKNGTNLTDSVQVMGSNTTNLTLLDVSQADSGFYDVAITNVYGERTSGTATLAVTLMPANATPIVVNGFVIGAALLDGGCGYSNPPAVTILGQSGSGAVAIAQLDNGSVTNILLASAGEGYPTNASLQIAPPIYPLLNIAQALTNSPPATARPVITNGFVVGVNLTSGGSAYTQAPSVSFRDVSGHGATAYAQIGNGSVTNIVVTQAGSGYSTQTVIDIPPATLLTAVTLNASNLMAGQSYQLDVANDFQHWTNCGPAFIATNTSWTSPGFWNVSLTNHGLFRLQMPQ